MMRIVLERQGRWPGVTLCPLRRVDDLQLALVRVASGCCGETDRVHPDYSADPLWDNDGGAMVSLDALPVSET